MKKLFVMLLIMLAATTMFSQNIVSDTSTDDREYMYLENTRPIRNGRFVIKPHGVSFKLLKCSDERIGKLIEEFKNVEITDDVIFSMRSYTPYEFYLIICSKKVRGAIMPYGLRVEVPEARPIDKKNPRMMEIAVQFVGTDRIGAMERLTKINKTGIQDVGTMLWFMDLYKSVTGEEFEP